MIILSTEWGQMFFGSGEAETLRQLTNDKVVKFARVHSIPTTGVDIWVALFRPDQQPPFKADVLGDVRICNERARIKPRKNI